jgi:hypothetical protein
VTCGVCQGKGLVRVNWADAAEDYAVCLCAHGLALRVNRNYTAHQVAALWQLWGAREGIDPSRILMLEDVLTADELTARGLAAGVEPRQDREAALLASGKTRKVKL